MVFRAAICCSIFLIAQSCGPMQGADRSELELELDTPLKYLIVCQIHPWVCGLPPRTSSATTTAEPATVPIEVLTVPYPGQPQTPEEAMTNLQKSINQAFTKMLSDVGLSPTINYTLHGYEPDDVVIGRDKSNNEVWQYNVDGYIVKDNIVTAFGNNSRYEKTLSIRLNNIRFAFDHEFWKQTVAVFTTYLESLKNVAIHGSDVYYE